jgi:hypothetical protein
MDTKTFLSAIRQVIKEEVRSAIRTELKQILSENNIKKTTESTIQHGINLHKQTTYTKPAAKKQTNFSSNSMINSILNDTAVTMNPKELYDEGPAISYSDPLMMEHNDTFSFSSADAPGFGMMQQMRGATPNAIPTTDIDGRRVDVNALPEDVTKALTRDYSALMKAIDKKKGK